MPYCSRRGWEFVGEADANAEEELRTSFPQGRPWLAGEGKRLHVVSRMSNQGRLGTQLARVLDPVLLSRHEIVGQHRVVERRVWLGRARRGGTAGACVQARQRPTCARVVVREHGTLEPGSQRAVCACKEWAPVGWRAALVKGGCQGPRCNQTNILQTCACSVQQPGLLLCPGPQPPEPRQRPQAYR